MPGLLVSRTFLERFGDRLRAVEADAAIEIDHIVLDAEHDVALTADDLERVDAAFYSIDLRYHLKQFFAAIDAAPNLRWLQHFAVGIEKSRFPVQVERGAVITNSPGASAGPIALTVLGAILRLGRPFDHWETGQREHSWNPIHFDHAPRDLEGQVLVLIGTGEIGSRIARHAQYIGLHVVGVRRSPPRNGEPFDEVHHPDALPEVLPRADWLVLACPLTEETHRLIDARALALLPRGAKVINIARGAVIDQDAFIGAVRSGQVGAAYLDVTDPEPLPPDSELWELPGVLISPHNSSISVGYPKESAERFFANLVRWCRGEPLNGVL